MGSVFKYKLSNGKINVGRGACLADIVVDMEDYHLVKRDNKEHYIWISYLPYVRFDKIRYSQCYNFISIMSKYFPEYRNIIRNLNTPMSRTLISHYSTDFVFPVGITWKHGINLNYINLSYRILRALDEEYPLVQNFLSLRDVIKEDYPALSDGVIFTLANHVSYKKGRFVNRVIGDYVGGHNTLCYNKKIMLDPMERIKEARTCGDDPFDESTLDGDISEAAGSALWFGADPEKMFFQSYNQLCDRGREVFGEDKYGAYYVPSREDNIQFNPILWAEEMVEVNLSNDPEYKYIRGETNEY